MGRARPARLGRPAPGRFSLSPGHRAPDRGRQRPGYHLPADAVSVVRAVSMKIAMFYHTLLSDWNHGNAHFLRGIASELISRAHEVNIYEPRDSWSLQNLLTEHGWEPVRRFQEAYPMLKANRYDLNGLNLERELR